MVILLLPFTVYYFSLHKILKKLDYLLKYLTPRRLKMLGVRYAANAGTASRFVDNFKFATRKELENRNANAQPNWCEKLGAAQLWLWEELPGKLKRVAKDPRVVTLALTALALYTVSFGFYNQITRELTKRAIQALPQISGKVVRFALWAFTMNTIVGYHNRAQGRFWNTSLTDQFWGIEREPKKNAPTVFTLR